MWWTLAAGLFQQAAQPADLQVGTFEPPRTSPAVAIVGTILGVAVLGGVVYFLVKE